MPSTIDDRDAQAKMSEAQPNFAAVWLPYEEGRELARQNRLEEAIPKYEQAMQAGERLVGSKRSEMIPFCRCFPPATSAPADRRMPFRSTYGSRRYAFASGDM